jgi:hypothetical protein
VGSEKPAASRSEPASTEVTPLYVLEPPSDSAPAPRFTSPPEPPSPASAEAMPTSKPAVSITAPPSPTVQVKFSPLTKDALSARAFRVPPLKLTVFVPYAPASSWTSESVPPFKRIVERLTVEACPLPR